MITMPKKLLYVTLSLSATFLAFFSLNAYKMESPESNQSHVVPSYKMDSPNAHSQTVPSYKMDKKNQVEGVPEQQASYKMKPVQTNTGDQGGKSFLSQVTGGLISLDRAYPIQSVKIENSTDYQLIIVKADAPLFEGTATLTEKGPTDAIVIDKNTKDFVLARDIRDVNKPEVYEYIAFFVFDDEPIEVCRFLFGIDCNSEIMHMEIPEHYNNPNKKDQTFFVERFDKLPQEGECGLIKENKLPDNMFPRLRHKELFTKWGAYHRNFSNITYKTSLGNSYNIGTMGIYLMADAHWIGIYFRDIKK